MTAATDKTPAQLLREGADLIERRGWMQGDYMRDGDDPVSCPVCAAGAINYVAVGNPYGPEREPAIKTMHLLSRAVGTTSVSQWNDAPERTAAEVTAKMREVAETLDAAA